MNMKIKDLFLKPIDRPINGVIKADQMDAASVQRHWLARLGQNEA